MTYIFAVMKKQICTISFALSLLILTSLVLQSVHSYRHINDFLSEKKCNHQYAINKTVIAHQHHQLDHCLSCEFTFSTYIKSNLLSFSFYTTANFILYTNSYCKKITPFFKGSLFQLRAPPSYII